jgi:hypothetical protein
MAGRSFSVYVVNFTLAELLAGVSLFVPDGAQPPAWTRGPHGAGAECVYSKESPWHGEL